MARRDTAKLAMESDPASNRWFSRAWVLPPPKRRTPGAPTPGQVFASKISGIIDTVPLTKAQARVLAERLFALEAGMNHAAWRRTTAHERAGGADDQQP